MQQRSRLLTLLPLWSPCRFTFCHVGGHGSPDTTGCLLQKSQCPPNLLSGSDDCSAWLPAVLIESREMAVRSARLAGSNVTKWCRVGIAKPDNSTVSTAGLLQAEASSPMWSADEIRQHSPGLPRMMPRERHQQTATSRN